MINLHRLLLAVGLLITLTSSFALPPCQGSAASKWSNCYGSWTAPDGNQYIGEWKNGTFNGQGTYIWTDDAKHVGEYRDGVRNGQGTSIYSNGDKYVGEWKDDKRNGLGTYFTLADNLWKGDKYVGEFKDNKFSGQGTYYNLADNQWKGMKYIGEWLDDKKNGLGIFYKPDGSISQTGIWNDGTLVTSQYVDPNRFTRIAKGNSDPSAAETQRRENERKAAQLEEERKRIEEEKRQIALERQRLESQKTKSLSPCQGADDSKWNDCVGTYTWSDGEKYVGNWKDGHQSGQGSYIRANGNRYVGEFLKGQRDGQGTHTWADGGEYVGAWKDGEANGQGTFTSSSGGKYVGEWSGGHRNGLGIEYLADGRISQSGIWTEDKLVTSKYVDPNSFTRIAKGNGAPPAGEAQRLENERKAAQLEEERKRIEEEKRQIALERQRTESQKGQPQIAPDNRRRLALVIGNDTYSSLPRLNNAVNDARAMSDALRQANFEVTSLSNLDKQRMEDSLRNFTKKLRPDDVGLFYFSGHGIQADNRNFLIPVAENVKNSRDATYQGVDVNLVMDNLKDAKNALNIVVLDACRSSLPDARGGMSRGLTVTEAPQGSIVAYATSPGKAASDGDGGNSPFTKNLIRVMQRKGMKIEDAFKEVRQSVIRDTNGEQVP